MSRQSVCGEFGKRGCGSHAFYCGISLKIYLILTSHIYRFRIFIKKSHVPFHLVRQVGGGCPNRIYTRTDHLKPPTSRRIPNIFASNFARHRTSIVYLPQAIQAHITSLTTTTIANMFGGKLTLCYSPTLIPDAAKRTHLLTNTSTAPPPPSKAELEEAERQAMSEVKWTTAACIVLYLCTPFPPPSLCSQYSLYVDVDG